jgi:hypothetical protein
MREENVGKWRRFGSPFFAYFCADIAGPQPLSPFPLSTRHSILRSFVLAVGACRAARVV